MGARNGIDYEEALSDLEKWYKRALDYKNNAEKLTEYAGLIRGLRNRLGAASADTDREFQIYQRANLLSNEVTRLIDQQTRNLPHILVQKPAVSKEIQNDLPAMPTSNDPLGFVEYAKALYYKAMQTNDPERLRFLYGAFFLVFSIAESWPTSRVYRDATRQIEHYAREVDTLMVMANKSAGTAASSVGRTSRNERPSSMLAGIVLREGESERLLPTRYESGSLALDAAKNLLRRLLPTLRKEENDEHINVGSTANQVSLVSARTGTVYMTARTVTWDAYARDHPTNVIRET
jgi:hypothetical protein